MISSTASSVSWSCNLILIISYKQNAIKNQHTADIPKNRPRSVIAVLPILGLIRISQKVIEANVNFIFGCLTMILKYMEHRIELFLQTFLQYQFEWILNQIRTWSIESKSINVKGKNVI